MSLIQQAIVGNRSYAKNPDAGLRDRPMPGLAVVTCMDPRVSDLPAILGLQHSDLDVIRTAGPAVTSDVVAELIASTRVIGTKEIMILNHTGCGFTTFSDDDLNSRLADVTGDSSPVPTEFFSYTDPVGHTREQIKAVRAHPWIDTDIPIRGFVLDMETGLIEEVQAD